MKHTRSAAILLALLCVPLWSQPESLSFSMYPLSSLDHSGEYGEGAGFGSALSLGFENQAELGLQADYISHNEKAGPHHADQYRYNFLNTYQIFKFGFVSWRAGGHSGYTFSRNTSGFRHHEMDIGADLSLHFGIGSRFGIFTSASPSYYFFDRGRFMTSLSMGFRIVPFK